MVQSSAFLFQSLSGGTHTGKQLLRIDKLDMAHVPSHFMIRPCGYSRPWEYRLYLEFKNTPVYCTVTNAALVNQVIFMIFVGVYDALRI
jgi:hypothetical protein